MKKAVKWLAIALVVLALTAVVALLIANNKYQLFAGPKISHEVFVSPGTSMRAVIQPALAKPLILEKL